jgi:cyclopropane-fatty-acyl-phospholipid synthase
MIWMFSRFFLKKVFGSLLNKVPDKVRVVFSNGMEMKNYRSGEPVLTVRFKNRKGEHWSAVFFYQGLVESYIAGDVELEAEFPMQALTDIGRRAIQEKAAGAEDASPIFNPLMSLRQVFQEWQQDNYDHGQAKKNAIHHYGHDPRFFEYLLGGTVGYSEGYWTENTKTLDQAKHNNYEYICRKLMLKPGEQVVEVGAGWGFLPIYMVKKYGVRVTVYNPVPQQNDYMRKRFKAQDVSEHINLIEGDHRDIATRKNEFDKYVSIGVYEHAGLKERQYDSWVSSISTCLKEGGIGLISSTTFMERGMTEFLILKYIFPGGHIPSLPLTLAKMKEYRLHLIDVENLWPHYQKTLMCWRDNLYRHWEKIHALNPSVFDESFKRAWLMYLEGTVDVFDKRMDLSHILFTKGRGRDYYPWVRSHASQANFSEGNEYPECYPLGNAQS